MALSAFARIFLSVIAAEDEEAELPIRSNGKMSQFQWISAFDRYAMAAAVTGEWSFAGAMAHKDIVMQASFRAHVCLLVCLFVVFAQIMYDAPTKGNRNFLGIVYDKMARSKWAQRAAANEPGFDVNVVCLKARVSRFVSWLCLAPGFGPAGGQFHFGGRGDDAQSAVARLWP